MILREKEAFDKLCWMSDWVAGKHHCEGSKCMAWRWLPKDENTPMNDKAEWVLSGYCGPAGKPEIT